MGVNQDNLILSILALVVIVGGGIITFAINMSPETPGAKTSTSTVYGTVKTVEHDKHLFVMSYNGGMVHHPDCECGE